MHTLCQSRPRAQNLHSDSVGERQVYLSSAFQKNVQAVALALSRYCPKGKTGPGVLVKGVPRAGGQKGAG